MGYQEAGILLGQYSRVDVFNDSEVIIIEPPKLSTDHAYLFLDPDKDIYTGEEINPNLFIDKTEAGEPLGIEWQNISRGVFISNKLPLTDALRSKVEYVFRREGYLVIGKISLN